MTRYEITRPISLFEAQEITEEFTWYCNPKEDGGWYEDDPIGMYRDGMSWALHANGIPHSWDGVPAPVQED